MNFLFIFVFLSQTDTQFLEQVTQKVFKKKCPELFHKCSRKTLVEKPSLSIAAGRKFSGEFPVKGSIAAEYLKVTVSYLFNYDPEETILFRLLRSYYYKVNYYVV